MAELVLGLASSHSPQLSTPSDGWAGRGERDKGNPELIGTDGITSNYEGLLARADTARIAKEITPAKFEQRHQQNQQAIAHLAKKLYDARLDVLVMVGDDQHEYLLDDNMPAFCVYWGDEVKVSGQRGRPLHRQPTADWLQHRGRVRAHRLRAGLAYHRQPDGRRV